jgi:hypothetical protein
MPRYVHGATCAVTFAVLVLPMSGCTSRPALLDSVSSGTVPGAGSADPASMSEAQWAQEMSKIPVPTTGCFEAAHPKLEWVEVPCANIPPHPLGPAVSNGSPGQIIGIAGPGNDYSAQVPHGTITTAVGRFQSVSGVTSENDSLSGLSNQYTLQLNTSYFQSSICNGAADPSQCSAWQQFAYENNGGNSVTWMQYWLLHYVNPCPSGWLQGPVSLGLGDDCYTDSHMKTFVPAQALTDLANLSVTGSVVASGNDTVTLTTPGHMYAASDLDSMVYAAPAWNTAEFNVFGGGSASQATFNNGAILTVAVGLTTTVGTSSPGCFSYSYTGETANVNLVSGSCCPTGGASPGIVFTETNLTSGVLPPFCLLNDITPALYPLM